MAEYQEYLAIINRDPDDPSALSAIERLGESPISPEVASALDEARRALRERGRLEVVSRLLDVEINAAPDESRRADLLLEKGQLHADDFLDEPSAVECFNQVLELRPGDESAQEILAHLGLVRENWEKIVEKYLEEARVSTDRQLTTSLYLSAAETYARYRPEGTEEVERYLRKALEVDAKNRRAARHLERLLRRQERWDDLAALYEQRVELADDKEERVQALLGMADLAKGRLDKPDVALDAMTKVLAIDPKHPRALEALAATYEADENWSGLIMLYTNALKAGRRGQDPDTEVANLMQIAMLHWKRMDNPDAAEEYFRRIRKIDPAHAATLDFYREYHRARDEGNKLLQVLRQAHRSVPADASERRRALSVEIAEVAESELGNPEKAIDAWKAILRAEPESTDARVALARLYRRTQKWNALLDLMKDEIERIPAENVSARIERLHEVVEIYRDRVKLPSMVINTYNNILELDPKNIPALDALADKYTEQGSWNDLIAVLGRKAGLEHLDKGERARLYREIADLWVQRFGNYAQAVKPLESLLEIAPGDADAIAKLKEIYTRRRQWRALIGLLEREATHQPVEDRRDILVEMARLASDRLGDTRLAIDAWNRVLELPGGDADREAVSALAHLYDRDKRHVALAEIYWRQVELAEGDREAIAILERLGNLLAERLSAPARAAEVYRKILTYDPGHAKAARILRELYATAGDYEALEQLYTQLEHWDELVEAFLAIADRLQDREQKIDLLERAATVASQHFRSVERIARVYERLLSAEPVHEGAAQALVPIYRELQKWARLLSTYEILLEHAQTDERRLELHLEIRDLCEEHLGSKALAFQWTARAYELKPDDDALIRDLERLGAEADAWEEVAEILDRRVDSDGVDETEKLRLFRELGRIAAVRLHDPDRARAYQRRVLELSPDDEQAMSAIEEIASQQADWPDLLRIYRRRAELADTDEAKLDLLFKIAFLEEERLADLDGAAATYARILEIDPSARRALRALSKLHDARGDWAGLARVLERELELASDSEARVSLLLRLGEIYERSLGDAERALDRYKAALDIAPSRNAVHQALERFLRGGPGEETPPVSAADKADVARRLLPIYEREGDAEKIARVLEVLREDASAEAATGYDERLVTLYGRRLGRPEPAYEAARRVFAQRPGDASMRAELLRLADEIGRHADLAAAYEKVVAGEDEGVMAGAGRDLLAELAGLYRTGVGDLERAERCYRRVLDEAPGDAEAYDALGEIYRSGERWRELCDLLEQRDAHVADAKTRKALLSQICELNEGVLADQDAAVRAYERLLDVDPATKAAYRALARLYAERESWRELEDVLGRELEHITDPDERLERIYQRARVRASHLGDPQGAVDLLEEVVAQDHGHAGARELLESLLPGADLRVRIARILEPLYEEDAMHGDLCAVLRAQREFASGAFEAVELLARIASIEEERLHRDEDAFATWIEALEVEPRDERAREAVRRLASLLDAWERAAAAYEKALEVADAAVRGDLLAELAALYDRNLADTERAISAYGRLLEADVSDPEVLREAGVALARLYEEEARWHDLIDILRRQADWAHGDERGQILARAADIYERKLGDVEAAIGTWREVASDDPDDLDALGALERLFAGGERYGDLIEVLQRRAELSAQPAEKKALLRRVAGIAETQLRDASGAITSHLEILDHLPDDEDALSELSRLYRTEERYADLLEIAERQLGLAEEGSQRAGRLTEIGRLLADKLDRPAEALERFAEALGDVPDDEAALSAVEDFVADDEHVLRAAEILEPTYVAAGELGKLAGLLERRAEVSGDPRDRIRYLRRAAQMRERDLGDPDGAFSCYQRVAADALAEPDLPAIIEELERLAAAQEREGDLIEIYREIAPDVLDGEVQRRLYLDIADLARAVRQDVELSREYYQRVLDAYPDDERALSALEFIYRSGEEWERLYEVLARKSELATGDAETRVFALSESARLCADKLDRPEEAVLAWEQVLGIAPDSREAAAALEELYERAGRFHDLADLLERRLSHAMTLEEAVTLRYRLGEIFEGELHDPDTAVSHYSAALGGDPSHAAATQALERFLDDPGSRAVAAEVLEPIYVSRQDWANLVRIYEIKLEAAEHVDERLALTRYVARLYEDQLEDLEGAFRWYGRLFREAPGNAGARDQLVRLASVLESWESLANIYQEVLDDHPEEGGEVRDVALALAEICDRRLGEIGRAQAAYQRALAAQPDDAQTFEKLESMLVRGERWYALIDVYEDATQAAEDEAHRSELIIRSARIHEWRLHDPMRAIDAYRSVLADDPDARVAAEELERLYREHGHWFDLAELLSSRVERAPSESEATALRVRLADVLETRLEDPDGAIDQYETILQDEGADRAGAEAALASLERLVLEDRHRERITGLLEPVYRAHDWWQKLVVILDARLEYVEDPGDRVEMLREIASLHETRGGDPSLALGALSRAWLEDPNDESIYAELAALAAKLGAWDDFVATLEKGIADQYDTWLVSRSLARVAAIHEHSRRDRRSAIAAWRRLLEVQEDDPDALGALDRLLSAEERHEELVDVLQRRAELADDPDDRISLYRRVAALEEESLGRTHEAIAALKSVLSVDEADADALDALDRLYRAEGEDAELAGVLMRKIELASDRDARRSLYFEAARVYDEQLNDVYEAMAQLRAVLDESPDDPDALSALGTLYEREAMWPELLEVLDRHAELAADAQDRANLGFRAAKIVQHELAEPEAAIERYAAVLALSPEHEGARRAVDLMTTEEETLDPASAVLEGLYQNEGAYDELAELYERRLKVSRADPDVRRAQYAALAELHERSRSDLDAAFAVWARALAEAPEDTAIQSELERLASTRGAWEELATIFERQLESIVDAELEYAYATRLAKLYEEALGDLDRAAAQYRRALDAAPATEEDALAALARIYERAGKSTELAEILARQADATLDEGEQAEILFRLGDVREQALGDVAGAVTAYRDVLERAQAHRAARAALERLLAGGQEQAEIIAILEPLYESEGDSARLADLLVTKLGITDDRFDRMAIYSRVVELAESRLGDPVRALDAAGGWLAEDPQSEQALAELERLAEEVDRFGEVAARLSGIVHSVDDDDVRRPLWSKLGQIQLERLGDTGAAEQAFREVLKLEPEDGYALESLERVYRTRSDEAELADVLARRAELSYDAEVGKSCFAEVGEIRERLGDDEGAVDAWRAVLRLDEGSRAAHARLAALYERSDRPEDLIEISEIAARFAEGPDEERSLRARIAWLYTHRVQDYDRAVDAWNAVLDVAPGALDALDALESVQREREDWLAVQEVLTRRLDLAASDGERVEVFGRLAEVAETQRGEPDEAVGYLQQVLDLDEGHFPTYDELERLLAAHERWHELVELCERRASACARAGDYRGEVGALARAADIWEGPLENPDGASDILEQILSRDPNSVPALTRLSKIYEGAGELDRCSEVLERAVALGPTGRDAADLYCRLGEVTQKQAGDDARAGEYFAQALHHDGRHPAAVTALEAIAREQEDWVAVADMVTRRELISEDPKEKLDLTLELADLYQNRLGRPAAVIPLLEKAAEAHPDDERVRGPLADLYLAAGRAKEAAPIYEALAESAKKRRKMKDVAHYRQRLGAIFIETGDRDAALAAYEEAFRVNPTDVATMAGLGRLYVEREEWEKARRVYRSLVLQNIDPALGISKADVYYQLGTIHARLGEPQKAKGMYQRGLEIDPSHAGLKGALETV